MGRPLKHGSTILHVAFSPNGKRLVTTSDDNTAMIWDLKTGDLLTQPLKHHANVLFAVFSPNGRLVVTAGEDNCARVWDPTTGEPLTPPLRFTGVVHDAEFAADSSQVSVTNTEGTKWTWDLHGEERSVDELLRLAQVLAGSQVDAQRGPLPLQPEALREAWRVALAGANR
jgi:WD40 repeat protein